MTDEFSKFIKGVVIPNKEGETIVKAIQNTWVFGTAGTLLLWNLSSSRPGAILNHRNFKLKP